MSRRDRAATHEALLAAGRSLMARHGYAAVTLAQVAKAAGVSRQAVYLHFGSRANFLTEIADYIWRQAELPDPHELVRSAASAHEALHRLIELRARSSELLGPYHHIPTAADSSDAEVAEAYTRRQRARLAVFVAVAKRMKSEGVLRGGVSVNAAAELMWSVLSVPVWRYLADMQGWSHGVFVKRMDDFLTHALLIERDQPGLRARV
jgi:AcrR family transcriptional regulator